MNHIIRKYLPVLNLVTIALCAFLFAQGLSRYVGASLIPMRTAKHAFRKMEIGSKTASAPERDVSHIISRNIFCSTCNGEENGASGDDESTVAKNEGPLKTSLKLRLIATIVSESNEAWSYASVLDEETDTISLYAIGDKVPGDAQLTEITERLIYLLTKEGNQEYLAMSDNVDEKRVSSSAKPWTKTGITELGPHAPGLYLPEPLKGLEDVARGIRRETGYNYEISRRVFHKLLSKPDLLAMGGRLVQQQTNGKPDGFRFFGKRGSVGSMLGLFGGDSIKSINGKRVTTPEQAWRILRGNRRSNRIVMEYDRKGIRITHTYLIK